MSLRAHYTGADIAASLRQVGVREGDTVFSHTGVAMLGIPEVGLDEAAIGEMFLAAIREVVGPEGTWVLPTYTYSYTKGEPFDPVATPPTQDMGLLPNALWDHPDARRSLDPIFAVTAIGRRAEELTAGVPETCFGADSIYAKLIELDAAICNVGIGAHAALLHHVEEMVGVPYRFHKPFSGVTVIDAEPVQTEILYNVRDLDRPQDEAYFMRLDSDGRADGLVVSAPLGRGEVSMIRARRMEALAREGLSRDPGYLVVGTSSASPAST